MQTPCNPHEGEAQPLDLQQAFQDRFIADRLPPWLRNLSPEHARLLAETLRQSLTIRQQLGAVLARIEGIDSFAQSRLQQALEQHSGGEFNVRQWSFIAGRREPVINSQPVGAHLTEVVYADMPLLEAALRNFTAEQAEAAGQPRGNRLTSARQGTLKPPSAIAFAGLCRQLDLGGQYQHHLDNLLTPEVAELMGAAQRQQMLADACQARHTGVLDEDELQLIAGLCRDGVLPRLQGSPVVARQLRLLGCNLQQIVVLDVIEEGLLRNTTRRVLAYVPADPHGPWSVFSSLRRLANDLGRRLRSTDYQRFFSRFVRRRDSQHFFSIVITAYADLAIWANYDLEEYVYAYRPPLFTSLGMARVRQIKDDAAMIAVPVADLDRTVQQAHDQRLATEGWALLNLAGLFIPVIGAGLLAATAWELLTEVCHGVEAWRLGDTREALDHLTHVATDLAVMGATAAGVVVAQRAWQRSALVDSLLPEQLEDGTTRLCSPLLADYRSAPPPLQALADEQGVFRHGDRAWVEMEGRHYPVVPRAVAGQWRLRPRAGYGPRLCDNGAGAWRPWYEQPGLWDDRYYLCRRLGGRFSELDDEQIDQLMMAHDLQADHLRALHVQGQAPQAAMVDSAERLCLDRRISELIEGLRTGAQSADAQLLQLARALPGAQALDDPPLAEWLAVHRRLLFQRAYAAAQPASNAQTAVLRRLFASVHEPAARALLREAHVTDRRQLAASGRVPLRLAEAARLQALAIRQAKVFEALYLQVPQHTDLARVALAMLEHLPAGTQVRWSLFEGDALRPLLTAGEAGVRAFGLRQQEGAFRLLDAQGEALGEPGELFEVMAGAYGDSQREALGVGEPFAHNLRVLLTRLAATHRDQVAQALGRRTAYGWFRPPQRLLDGRLGYPLSGRGVGGTNRNRPMALYAMVRALYPTFSDAQVLAWVEDLRNAGVDVRAEVTRLGNEMAALDQHLGQWVGQAPPGERRDDRRYLRRCLIDCWQRRVTAGGHPCASAAELPFCHLRCRARQLARIAGTGQFRPCVRVGLAGHGIGGYPHVISLGVPQRADPRTQWQSPDPGAGGHRAAGLTARTGLVQQSHRAGRRSGRGAGRVRVPGIPQPVVQSAGSRVLLAGPAPAAPAVPAQHWPARVSVWAAGLPGPAPVRPARQPDRQFAGQFSSGTGLEPT